MTAIVIEIGNLDEKVPDGKWADFVSALNRAIGARVERVHFFGRAESTSKRQDATWVVEMESQLGAVESLCTDLAAIRAVFKQDAVAMSIGDKQLV